MGTHLKMLNHTRKSREKSSTPMLTIPKIKIEDVSLLLNSSALYCTYFDGT